MVDEAKLWEAAVSDAGLTAEERLRFDRALSDDEVLREELLYLVSHLSGNHGATFVRTFVDLLTERRVRPAAGLVMPALEAIVVEGLPSA
jgi:hypothetical protein